VVLVQKLFLKLFSAASAPRGQVKPNLWKSAFLWLFLLAAIEVLKLPRGGRSTNLSQLPLSRFCLAPPKSEKYAPRDRTSIKSFTQEMAAIMDVERLDLGFARVVCHYGK
jgi:hypothetical protein